MVSRLRIAQVLHHMNLGGIEAVVINYYRAIDKTQVQFDFFVEAGSVVPFRDELENSGANVIELPTLRNPIAYIYALRKVLWDEKYAAVHAHMNTLSVFSLFAAWLARVPVRICHNHTTAHAIEGKRTRIKYLLRPFAPLFATHLFACSQAAGEWMYGKRAYERGHVYVLKNAIDLDQYRFDAQKRATLREELGVGDGVVVGHVGRFCQQKNHEFLLEIFEKIVARMPDAMLMLVGTGDTLPAMQGKARALGIADNIRFMGEQMNMSAIYSAMDVFVLPSYYEGLPVVGIEAQTASLPCIFSGDISSEINLTSNAHSLPLGDATRWANEVLALCKQPRSEDIAPLVTAGYSIRQEVSRLLDFYLTAAGQVALAKQKGMVKL